MRVRTDGKSLDQEKEDSMCELKNTTTEEKGIGKGRNRKRRKRRDVEKGVKRQREKEEEASNVSSSDSDGASKDSIEEDPLLFFLRSCGGDTYSKQEEEDIKGMAEEEEEGRNANKSILPHSKNVDSSFLARRLAAAAEAGMMAAAVAW